MIDFNDINNVSLKLSQCVKHFDSIDAVLHIAGGGFGVKEYAPSRDDYMKVFNINLFSIFEINRIIIPIMKKKKKGVLFHVGSIASNESVGSLSYNIAKSSISTYVRSLSKPLAKYNICVSGISPGGFIYSKNSMNRLKTNNNKAYNQFIAKRLPLKRMPKAEELLPIIKVIIENHMMFTGSMISCDAGEGNFYKTFYENVLQTNPRKNLFTKTFLQKCFANLVLTSSLVAQ